MVDPETAPPNTEERGLKKVSARDVDSGQRTREVFGQCASPMSKDSGHRITDGRFPRSLTTDHRSVFRGLENESCKL